MTTTAPTPHRHLPRNRRTIALASVVTTLAMSVATFAFAGPASAQHPDREDPAAPASAESSAYVVTLAPQPPGVVVPQGLPVSPGDVTEVFDEVLDGFAAELTPDEVATLRNDRRVRSVEPDIEVRALGLQRVGTWGLDRIDQVDRNLDGRFTYPDNPGRGVTVYVVDTGVWPEHDDLAGRVAPGFTAFSDRWGTSDCHGHGTHVAGTAAGTEWGVAKSARIVPVRVLGCDGYGSAIGVIDGLDWIAANHRGGPAVVNMSLGSSSYQPINDAVARVVSLGITVVVSAGNENANACSASPASTPSAITVGATDINDQRAVFSRWGSNWGPCVDLFAPGVAISSASIAAPDAVVASSGTSMASPHVAGVAAVLLGASPSATPAAISTQITDSSVVNAVGDPGAGSPNRLLHLAPPPAPVCPFNDLGARSYFADAACWAFAEGITTGAGTDSTFSPSGAVDRAQMVTFLWRAAGKPTAPVRCGFGDVPATAYYASAVCWAVANGITTGAGNRATFKPLDRLDRAQAATFLWRAAGKPVATARCGFGDVPADSYFAYASCWMLHQGITEGRDGGVRFDPAGSMDRAQAVTFLWRAAGRP